MLVLAIDKDDSIIHVKDSERGKDYCCPECGETIRCRKGEINAHHFFHLNSDCQSNGEEVYIYIPSKRMRDLLIDWMNEELYDFN